MLILQTNSATFSSSSFRLRTFTYKYLRIMIPPPFNLLFIMMVYIRSSPGISLCHSNRYN